MRTTIIILSIIALGGGIYFFIRKREAKNREDAIERLYKTANILGSDMFQGYTTEQAKARIIGGTAAEINQFTDLMIKPVRNCTPNEIILFESLWIKMTGKSIAA